MRTQFKFALSGWGASKRGWSNRGLPAPRALRAVPVQRCHTVRATTPVVPCKPQRTTPNRSRVGDGAPERRLMLAVLSDALAILTRRGEFATGCNRRLEWETRDWFMSDDISWPFSFLNVCDVLDMNAVSVRRHLGQLREDCVPTRPTLPAWLASA